MTREKASLCLHSLMRRWFAVNTFAQSSKWCNPWLWGCSRDTTGIAIFSGMGSDAEADIAEMNITAIVNSP